MAVESVSNVQSELNEKPWQSNIKSLMDGFSHILKTGEFSDLTINVKGSKFHCHRILLEAGSPKFADMFPNEDYPKELSLICPVKGFEIFLKFIYTNELEVTDRKGTLEAYRVAERFEQNNLKQKCEELISKWDIRPNNVCTILNEVCDIDFLKERCLQIIKENNLDVLKSEDFLKAIPLSVIDMFTNKCFVDVPILTLLHSIILWGTSHIGKPENNKSKLPVNKVIRDFLLGIGILGKLNIQKLSVEEILTFSLQYPDFLTAQESQQFTQFAFKKDQNMPLPEWCE